MARPMNPEDSAAVARMHLSRRIDDIDQLVASYRSSPSSCVQTTTGFGVSINGLVTPRLEIRDVAFDAGVINSITHPSPRLALILGVEGETRVMGKLLTSSSVGCVDLQSGLVARLKPGSRWCNITFDWNLLHRVAETHGYVIPTGDYSCGIPFSTHEMLISTLSRMVRNRLFTDLSDAEFEDELARLCLRLLSAPQRKCRGWHLVHERTIHRVIDIIQSEYASPLTVTDLCQQANIGERVLQYKFKEIVGCSVQKYLMFYRLHRARSMLLHGESQRVSDVASACGIHHAGRFSQYYRSLFGQSPRELLVAPKRFPDSRDRLSRLH